MPLIKPDIIRMMRYALDDPNHEFYSYAELGKWVDIGTIAVSTWGLVPRKVEEVSVTAVISSMTTADLRATFPQYNITKVLRVNVNTVERVEIPLLYPDGEYIYLPDGDNYLVMGYTRPAFRGAAQTIAGYLCGGDIDEIAFWSYFGDTLYVYPAPGADTVITIVFAISVTNVSLLPSEAQHAVYLYAMHLAYCKAQRIDAAAFMLRLFLMDILYLRQGIYHADIQAREEVKIL